jgi:DNA polymerase-3 subunit beta
MHIQTTRDALVDCLAPVQGVVDTKKSPPILSHLLLDAGEAGVRVFATDLDVGVRVPLDAHVDVPGAVAVSARRLHDIARELPDDAVEIRVGGEHQMVLRCRRSEFKLKGLPRDDFPRLPELQGHPAIGLLGGVLRDMIRKTLFAVSSDLTRHALNGVLLQIVDGEIRMVATDGHRLAIVRRPVGAAASSPVASALLPRKALSEIAKIIRDEAGPVAIHTTQEQAAFECPGGLLVTRLIDAQFPNYEQVLPASSPKSFTADREALQGALKRTATIGGERGNPTVVSLSRDRMILTCSDQDLGEATEEVEIEYQGAEMSIGFNGRYLLDFLGVVESDRVRVQASDPLSPALFEPVGETGYACVIMPMRA